MLNCSSAGSARARLHDEIDPSLTLGAAGGRNEQRDRPLGQSGIDLAPSARGVGDQCARLLVQDIARGGEVELAARQPERRRAYAFNNRDALQAELQLERADAARTAQTLLCPLKMPDSDDDIG
jgi:hypothetical protein